MSTVIERAFTLDDVTGVLWSPGIRSPRCTPVSASGPVPDADTTLAAFAKRTIEGAMRLFVECCHL
ncbi:hypothetical protein ACFTWF_38475 [Rhodococcus sp. NPDC056960]|uniref:hypothetical protein n=1 Tax=Rhodococcus sp. NPDC056960 TaxID=3345982 RepID=UPI0036316FF1